MIAIALDRPQSAAMRDDTAKRWRQRLSRFMRRRGLSPATWCQEAGLSKNALYAFLKGDTESLSMATLEKLAKAANASLLDFIMEPTSDAPAPTFPVIVIADVRAGAWRPSVEWDEDKRYVVDAPQLPGVSAQRFGLEVRGDSMDQVYPEGTIVICEPVGEITSPIEPGDRVIVERKDARGLFEMTIKELAVDDDGAAWLLPRSSNREWVGWKIPRENVENQAPTDCIEDGTIRVIAVVVGSFRRERRAR